MVTKKHEKNLNTSSVSTPRKEKDDGGGLKKMEERERERSFSLWMTFSIFSLFSFETFWIRI